MIPAPCPVCGWPAGFHDPHRAAREAIPAGLTYVRAGRWWVRRTEVAGLTGESSNPDTEVITGGDITTT